VLLAQAGLSPVYATTEPTGLRTADVPHSQYPRPAEQSAEHGHTPTTGAAYEKQMSYDALFIAGEEANEPLSKTIQVVGCELASQGFYALIGKHFLEDFRFIYDGPRRSFTLEYDVSWRPTSVFVSPTP
jgi:hypothetical protein